MPFKITVNIQKGAWLKKERDMRRATNYGLDTIAKKTADYLINNIFTYGLIWKERLLQSIKVERVRRSEINITMLFYGPIIEKGHTLPAGKRLPLLIAWAREKHPTPEAWLKKVYEEGYYVKPSPFITDAINSIEPQIDSLMLLKIKRVK